MSIYPKWEQKVEINLQKFEVEIKNDWQLRGLDSTKQNGGQKIQTILNRITV